MGRKFGRFLTMPLIFCCLVFVWFSGLLQAQDLARKEWNEYQRMQNHKRLIAERAGSANRGAATKTSTIEALSLPVDSDGDGMPDAWEQEHGLNPNDGADGSLDGNGDGYTNVEDYLNGLVR